jgi:hypothetical protein
VLLAIAGSSAESLAGREPGCIQACRDRNCGGLDPDGRSWEDTFQTCADDCVDAFNDPAMLGRIKCKALAQCFAVCGRRSGALRAACNRDRRICIRECPLESPAAAIRPMVPAVGC